ncbi:MAG TPA: amino acid adenylation domain-containing protein [Terriglobales bacterium]|nr:amino acid adenylation domain-containing protein [Terriglobales bacterium]
MSQLERTDSSSPQTTAHGGRKDVYVFPMSFAQQRLWFLDQLEPGNVAYNTPFVLSLEGELDYQALTKSLTEILRRHEVLRSTFCLRDGAPAQLIHPPKPMEIPVVDLEGIPDAERRVKVEQLAREEAHQPFDLQRGPIVRSRLLRITQDEHILLLTTHHIVFDGWSRSILFHELGSLYRDYCNGVAGSLPEPVIQYTDFAVWQNEQLSGTLLHNQLSYWKKQLAGAPTVLELPSDRPRPLASTFKGAALQSHISRELMEQVRLIGQQENATLFMTLLAVYELLLSRYSDQDDILVGCPVAGRNRTELEGLIGCFASTLVLRGNLAGSPTFRELLRRIRETALGAYTHQDLPFEKLVEEIQPERSLGHNPLFQVLFSLRNLPATTASLPGLKLKLLPNELTTAKLDLALFAVETADGLELRWEYSSELFDPGRIERMADHFERLLTEATAHSDIPVSELPLLTRGEQKQLLEDWNNTRTDYPRHKCLHQLFESQVKQTPTAIAVRFRNQHLTYAHLNQRANRLAHYLRKLHLARGERVGVYLERSLDMMVALLAVQKSGAAYVPIDPEYPAERIGLTLESASPRIIITQQSLATSLPPCAARIVNMDSDWPEIELESTANPLAEISSDDLMYVIFTSGSTGRPKGVQVHHRAVVNLLCFMAKELKMGTDDVFPALASFAFDMCVPELYLALILGGQVVIGDREIAANGEELAVWLKDIGATAVHATPTMWRLLLDAGFTGKGLKRVIGAEAVPQELCSRLLESEPSLYNFYGPTETTVWSTMQHLQSADEQVTIGRPLANTRVYLLDKNRRPVPTGVPGEIYIAGDGVSLGYLNQPELTAVRYIPEPWTDIPNSKMYRTGDVGRYLDDGRIEFLGRGDHQVKLRGFRIELGEIESVLKEQDAVEQALAIIREDHPNDRRLVAYVVLKPNSEISSSALKQLLRRRLPEYMVPSAIVLIPSLPLSPNGKIDRKRLPAPEHVVAETENVVAPRNATEHLLAEIWAEVLHRNHISVHDNFFDMGGHSLMATQVVARIRKQLDRNLPLRTFFEHPTIGGLATILEQYDKHLSGTDEPPIGPVARDAFRVRRSNI